MRFLFFFAETDSHFFGNEHSFAAKILPARWVGGWSAFKYHSKASDRSFCHNL